MALPMPEGKYIGSVRMGEKGQIVIPKEVRDMFHISPGDMLMLMADLERGIAIVDNESFLRLAQPLINQFGGEIKDE